MKAPFTVLLFVCLPFAYGCDPIGIDHFADSIDRFGGTITENAKDGGNLEKRIKQLTKEMREELVKGGKEVTEDAVAQFAKAREDTIRQIMKEIRELKLDTRILLQEFQGAGLSIPLHLDESLKNVRSDLKRDLSALLSASIIAGEKDAPSNYTGLTFRYRSTGYHTVSFQIREATTLQLKIGEKQIIPDKGAKLGDVEFRIPLDPKFDSYFDDTRDMAIGFQLVDVIKKKGAKDETKFRYGGFIRLAPRFPIEYDLKIIPARKSEPEQRHIEFGQGIMDILEGARGATVAVAQRHGAIYRSARSRLTLGTSWMEIPEGSHWNLAVRFPDGTRELLDTNNRVKTNSFGSVSVTGPNLVGEAWRLLVSVKLKES